MIKSIFAGFPLSSKLRTSFVLQIVILSYYTKTSWECVSPIADPKITFDGKHGQSMKTKYNYYNFENIAQVRK